MEVSRGELLCLTLSAASGGIDRTPVPARYSLPGLCEVVGHEEGGGALAVLDELDSLVEAGLVERTVRSIEGTDTQRQVFALTGDGQAHANQLRRRLVDEPATIRHDGREETIRLGDVEEYLDRELPLVRALVELQSRGVVDTDRHRPGKQFVGRDRVLGLFEETVWQAGAETVGLLVRGPTGVGKTAITKECARIARSTGGRVLTGRTPQAGSATYAVFRDVCTQLEDESTPFERITPPTDRMDASAYQSMRLSLFYEVYEQLLEHAREEPLLLVLEELQWAGRGTLDLLAFLLEKIDTASLTILCTVNTEYQDERTLLAQLDDVSDATLLPVDVDSLARPELDPLVRWHLEVEHVPTDFVDAVYEHTGGTPAFVTTLLDHLRETDRLDPGTDSYPSTLNTLTLPESVREVVESRLDRLDGTEQGVLEAAAVVGYRAGLPVLAEMTDHSESALRPIAQAIAETAVWEPSDTPMVPLSRTYEFQNPLVRQAVLEGIEADRRRRLHEHAAESVLEVPLAPTQLSEAVAARHFEAAECLDRALEAYHEAGDQARTNYAHDDASQYYERAIELADTLDRPETELDLLAALSRSKYCTGDSETAREYIERLLERADDPDRIQRAELSRWRMAKDRGDFEQADEYARAGIAAFDTPTTLSCRFWGKLGWTQLQRGEIEAAAEQFDQQEDVAEELVDDECYGNVFYHRAELARARGDPEEAIELAQRAIRYQERAGSPRDAAKSHMLLGIVYMDQTRIDEAAAAYETSLEHIQAVGDRVLEVYLDANRANCPVHRGEWDEALSLYEDTLETARTLDQPRVTTRLLSNSSIVHCHRGDLETARARARDALETASEIEEVAAVALAQCQLARIERLEGDLDAARTAAEAAREQASSATPVRTAEAEYRLGSIALADDETDVAIEHFRESRQQATDCGATEWRCRADAGLASALLSAGRTADSLKTAEPAVETATELGDPESVVRTQLALARTRRARGDTEGATAAAETALGTAGELDATMLECLALLEASLIDGMRSDPRAHRRLERAIDRVDSTGARLLESRCQTVADRLDQGTSISADVNPRE
jgi:predicted ATPase